jgi:lysophospholipase L1-like esterase
MKNTPTFFLLIFLLFKCTPKEQTTLHLIGDSTCAQKNENRYPETGWGEKFGKFFDDKISVQNYAKNGRSSRTFIEENRWDSVYSRIQTGDYVFIQFGHNDEVETKASYTTPEKFKANLKRFIADARAKQSNPVLLTPVCRRRFDDQGNFFDSHGQYARLTREVAEETSTDLIDMHTISMAILVQYGKEESTKLYLHCAPGECSNYPEGVTDDTHFSDLGATVMAEALAKAITGTEIPLRSHITIKKKL